MSRHRKPAGLATVQHAATNPFPPGALKILTAVFLTAALFVVSTGAFLYRSLADQVKNSALDISGLGSQTGPVEEPLPADQFEGRALNILVVGTDSRDGANAELGAGDTEEVDSLRGDTTMVVHVSADRSRIQVVSIPRDLWTEIPSCTRTDGSVSGWTEDQFNQAISIGANWGFDIASGIACTKSTVEYMTGLTIDAFVVVDFTGFISMVDSLGGVWFQLDEAVQDDYAGLDLPAGCQLLGGTQALAYARARYNVGDGSDISRIGRQQQLVSAMLRELLSKNYVTDFPALISFLQATISALQVSPNLADVNTDAGLLLSLLDIDRAKIEFVTMPNYPAPWNENRVVADEPMASDLWDALIADQSLPVGIEYTDGNGQVLTVPDPAAIAAQSTSSVTPESQADPTQVAEEDPTAPLPADTAQSETAQVKTCPPSN